MINSSLLFASGPKSSTSKSGSSSAGLERDLAFDTPIIIIEDEALIAWMFHSILEEMGFRAITIATCYEEALREANRVKPGLIVSDINLNAARDGIETTVEILRAGWMPVLFVTGHLSDEAQNRISRLVPGASVFRKPIRADGLRAAVSAALRRPQSH